MNLAELMRNLIVGIDPGKTSAIACIDLDGNIIVLNTERFAKTEWFIENIKKSGSPVIIASDKKPCKPYCSKVSYYFQCGSFYSKFGYACFKEKLVT